MTKPPVAAARPPAIPLPQTFEPHALEPAAGSGAQSRYPAKKAKRARSARATEPVATFPVDVRDGDVYVDVTTTLNGVTPS